MNVKRTRRAVTLMELLLVLVILTLVGATAWPMLDRSLADQRLRDAADMVRGEWSHARAKAMSSGVAYQFRYRPGERTFWIESCESEGFSGGSTSATGQAGAGESGDYQELPEDVLFVKGKVEKESAESDPGDEAAGLTSGAGGSQESAGDEPDTPIVFSPDGTCSSAEVTLRNEYDRGLTVAIHGLTAIADVGEVSQVEGGE